ncbi:MAG TPA: nucleoside deaminase [Methylocella sp.]|nr:nucleoside deaminase [Methylocella sp.]
MRRETLGQFLAAALTGLGLGAPRRAKASPTPRTLQPDDETFMRMALSEAGQADLPFGAVIVRDGRILATGRNLGKTNHDPTAHGEMVAIRRFVATFPAEELKGATLYTTGEPCPMCMGAILWCGFGRLVFAASIPELATKLGQIEIASETIARAAPFARISITGGVLAAEALALFS